MRKLGALTIIGALTLTLLSAGASAAPAVPEPCSEGQCRFYTFGGTVVDGKRLAPAALYIAARERPSFKRLMKLRKSFLPRLVDSGREAMTR